MPSAKNSSIHYHVTNFLARADFVSICPLVRLSKFRKRIQKLIVVIGFDVEKVDWHLRVFKYEVTKMTYVFANMRE